MFGVAHGCLPYFIRARTSAMLVVGRPQVVDAQHACTVPITWGTVHEVLRRSCLHARQRYMLHAGAGGVRLVAMEYLNWLRVPIFASVGQPHKHRLVHSLGAATACSSRESKAFSYGLARSIDQARFHCTCNSLVADFVTSSIALSAEVSSFQELGKRRAWSPSRMAAAGRRQSSVVDLALDMIDVKWFNRMLRKLAKQLQCSVAHGLPVTEFSIGKVRDAFQFLKAGRNIGKVVVSSLLTGLAPIELRADAGGGCHQRSRACSISHAPIDLQTICSIVKDIAGQEVDTDAPLMESGVDSLGAVELRNQLQHATGANVPSTLMFDHPTLRRLFASFEDRSNDATAAELTSCLHQRTASSSALICIAGMDALLTGGVQRSQAVRLVISTGGNIVSEVPVARWDVHTPPPLSEAIASRVRHGSFMRGMELVNNAAFAISPAEAAAMDPSQRLLLERGYAALHDANLDRTALGDSLTGVFLGFGSSEFAQLLAASPLASSVYAATGWSGSIASGRLSYTLGLFGPCASYDTACSASLVACYAGQRTLQLAECVTGLVVGASLMLMPSLGTTFAVAGMTSSRGRSHTFDARADGYARSEACGGVTLRGSMESDAPCFRGSAVRQDGRSASLTAPNGQAQQGLLVAVLSDADTPAQALSLLEAHGTGTALGDPIEAGSMTAAVLAVREKKLLGECGEPSMAHAHPLAVGGVKANFGHAEMAAGMTGLFKLLIGLRCGEAASNAQLRRLNPHVAGSLRDVSCMLPLMSSRWLAKARIGGVSSFGYSGTIAHVLLICHATCCTTLSKPLQYRRRSFELLNATHPFVQRRLPSSVCDAVYRSPAHGALSVLVAHHVVQHRVYRGRAFQWRDERHSFAQRALPVSADDTAVMRSPAAGTLHVLVHDHVVHGRIVFPGSGYLEMARASACAISVPSPTLQGVFFLKPLTVEALDLHIECAVFDGRFEIRSFEAPSDEHAMGDSAAHCSGALGAPHADLQRIKHEQRRGRVCVHAASVDALYDSFDAEGLQYGPGYRSLVQAWSGVGMAVARLQARATHQGTVVHPADLDDALCLGALLASQEVDGTTRLPFAVDDAQLRDVAGDLWAVRAHAPLL